MLRNRLKVLPALFFAIGCGPAVGPLQRGLDEREQFREELIASGNTAYALTLPSPEEKTDADHQNQVCTNLNFWKNFLTGTGGALTAGGGGVAIGTALATANNDNSTKEALGITAGAITGLGGAFVLVGAVLTQQFSDNQCTPANVLPRHHHLFGQPSGAPSPPGGPALPAPPPASSVAPTPTPH